MLHGVLEQEAPSQLVVAAWPTGGDLALDEAAEEEMATLQGVVGAVRQVRSLTMVGERKPMPAVVAAPRDEERAALERNAEAIRGLAYLESMDLGATAERPASSAVSVYGAVEVFVPLGDEVDTAKLKEVLENRARKVGAQIEGAKKKLANEKFVSRADPAVVEQERERQGELEVELALLERNLAGF